MKWRAINRQGKPTPGGHFLIRDWSMIASASPPTQGKRHWGLSAVIDDGQEPSGAQIARLHEAVACFGAPADVSKHVRIVEATDGQSIHYWSWYENVSNGAVEWAQEVEGVASPAGEGCSTPGCAMHHHSPEDMAKWEGECMERDGFFVHWVQLGDYVNTHTHGFPATWDHRDFGVVLPIDLDTASAIFWRLAELVESGRKLEDGQVYDDVLQGLRVRLALAREVDRDVLRVLLPDKSGKLPGEEGCDPIFDGQARVDTDKPPTPTGAP